MNETALLHLGGRAAGWGNLGLWTGPGDDYATACTALARAVGNAAGLQAGDRVLAIACGAGDELLLWRQDFGAAAVHGVERDAGRLQAARATVHALPGVTLHAGSGTALDALGLAEGSVDRVLCVDAAYHLHPAAAFLQGARRLLRPGGTLACTELVRAPGAPSAIVRAAARACGLAAGSLATPDQHLQRLADAGFADTRVQRLDEAVLGGFARFVRRQEARIGRARWSAAWRRPALTARLIGPCRAAGLGYAMLVATRPDATGADAMAASTA